MIDITLAQHAWRAGIAPLLSFEALLALRQALLGDDPRLIQGATTSPPPLHCVAQWEVEAACALGYCGWQTNAGKTVEEVEGYFARMCFDADQRLGEPAAVRWFLNWFDDTPRAEMRRQLLDEIQREIANRNAA